MSLRSLGWPAGTHCHADSDGACDWKECPQLRDGEPGKSGRHCPLDEGTYELHDDQGTCLIENVRAESASMVAQETADELGIIVQLVGPDISSRVYHLFRVYPTEAALGKLIAAASREVLAARDNLARAEARSSEAKHRLRLLTDTLAKKKDSQNAETMVELGLNRVYGWREGWMSMENGCSRPQSPAAAFGINYSNQRKWYVTDLKKGPEVPLAESNNSCYTAESAVVRAELLNRLFRGDG